MIQNNDISLLWWRLNVKYGDPVSFTVVNDDEGVKETKNLIYDRVESINIDMKTTDIVLFQEAKENLGKMNSAIPFRVHDISAVQSIGGVVYDHHHHHPGRDVSINSRTPETPSTDLSGSIPGVPRIRENMDKRDDDDNDNNNNNSMDRRDNMNRKKISWRMIMTTRMLRRKNLKSDRYVRLCADIDSMIMYMGYNAEIDRLLDRLMLKKKLMERKIIHLDNLMVFSDGSVYIPIPHEVSVHEVSAHETSLKKRSSRSSVPASNTGESGIYEKEGRFYCPCGKNYKTKYHAVFNHKQHVERAKSLSTTNG